MDIRLSSATASYPLKASSRNVVGVKLSPKDDPIARIDFQSMTVGEYIDTLNHLVRSGRITDDEALDIYITCIPPSTPCDSQVEHLAMPMRISYDHLRSEIADLTAAAKFEDRDRHQRVLSLLLTFDGTARKVHATA